MKARTHLLYPLTCQTLPAISIWLYSVWFRIHIQYCSAVVRVTFTTSRHFHPIRTKWMSLNRSSQADMASTNKSNSLLTSSKEVLSEKPLLMSITRVEDVAPSAGICGTQDKRRPEKKTTGKMLRVHKNELRHDGTYSTAHIRSIFRGHRSILRSTDLRCKQDTVGKLQYHGRHPCYCTVLVQTNTQYSGKLIFV